MATKFDPKQALSVLKHHWFFFTFIAIIVVIAAAFFAGFRVGPNFSIVRVGTLIVANVPDDTQVYVDQAHIASSANGTATAGVVPGTHTVIVAAVGYQPWSDLFSIESNGSLTLSPVLVPTHPSSGKLPAAETGAAAVAVHGAGIPTAAAPLTAGNGCEKVYVSQNRILAEAVAGASCTPPDYLCTDAGCPATLIFAPVDPIRSVSLYKGTQTVLLVSSGNLSYALEIDPRNPRFFAPVYKGVSPTAVTWTATSTLVYDAGKYFELDF